MTDRPIIFSAPMVRALLKGRKTMTRRLAWIAGWKGPPAFRSSQWQRVAVGDRLWVREAWADEHPLAVQSDRYSQHGRAGIPGPPSVEYRTIYRADGEPLQVWRNADGSHPYFTLAGPADELAAQYPTIQSNYTRAGKAIHWQTPIHMPRWASRLTLTVTETRVERLQDISREDEIAEGTPDGMFFDALWSSIHGADSWTANPEVVVLRFAVDQRNIDA